MTQVILSKFQAGRVMSLVTQWNTDSQPRKHKLNTDKSQVFTFLVHIGSQVIYFPSSQDSSHQNSDSSQLKL